MFKMMNGGSSIEGDVKETPDTTVEQAQQQAKRNKFLKIMSTIESSSGKNTQHRTLSSGIHKGERAIGQYGLMPNTIDEMHTRMKLDGQEDPRIKELYEQNLTPQERADRISSDPELEGVIANKLYDHVNERFQGDEEKMDHAWQYGHNINPTKLTPKVLQKSDRVKKYQLIKDSLDNPKPPVVKPTTFNPGPIS